METEQHFDLEDEIGRAWPDGLAASDALALARLPDEQRLRLARRIGAVRRWVEGGDGERQADVASAARMAGVGLTQFYQIAAAWRKERGLGALGMHFGARKPRASSISGWPRDRIVSSIRRFASADPDARPADIKRSLMDEGLCGISDGTLLRLIAQVRRERGPSAFGELIFFDGAGLDALDPEGYRLRLFAIIDGGTGLVLNWLEGTDRMMSQAYAVSASLAWLGDLDLTRFPIFAGEPRVEMAFHPQDLTGRALLTDPEGPVAASASTRALGSRLVSIVGERLGGTWLGTGQRAEGVGYRTGKPMHLPFYEGPVSDEIDEAIRRHNADRAAAGREGASDPAEVAGAVERMTALFASVASLEGAIAAGPEYRARDAV